MAPPPTIRKLIQTDSEAYRSLRLEAFQVSAESFSESFEDENDMPLEYFQVLMGFAEEHFTLGAFVNGRLVGAATFKRDRRSKARHKSSLHTMYVSPSQRGRGIAQALLKEILIEAQSMRGLEQIHLWVLNPEESAAKRIYARAGFQTQGAAVKKDLIIGGKYVDAEYLSSTLGS